MKKWREGSRRSLWARPIYENEIPLIVEAMKEDGLAAIIQADGIAWYYGGYDLTNKSVRDAWGLTRKQLRRVKDYILVHDPWAIRAKAMRDINGE